MVDPLYTQGKHADSGLKNTMLEAGISCATILSSWKLPNNSPGRDLGSASARRSGSLCYTQWQHP